MPPTVEQASINPPALRITVDRDFHRGETVWERFYTKRRALRPA